MIASLSEGIASIRSHARQLMNEAVTLESKVQALKQDAFALSGGDPALLLIDLVAHEFSVSVDDLRSRSRPDKIAFPRQVVMTIAVETLDMSKSEAARLVCRKPWTAMHAVDAVRRRCETEPRVARKVCAVRDSMAILMQPKPKNI